MVFLSPPRRTANAFFFRLSCPLDLMERCAVFSKLAFIYIPLPRAGLFYESHSRKLES